MKMRMIRLALAAGAGLIGVVAIAGPALAGPVKMF
jgi:hypothetical protein